MTITNSIIPIVKNLFPHLYQTEGRRLVQFVQKYYEYLEDETDSYAPLADIAKHIERGITDTSEGEFLRRLAAEFTPGVPENTIADQKLLAKRSLDIFDHSGTEIGFRLLFRALYNRYATLEKPSEYILKPSSGQWSKTDRITLLGTITVDVIGKRIVGAISGATAEVQDAVEEDRFGTKVTVLLLSRVRGRFENEESIKRLLDDALVGTIYGATGALEHATITSGGDGHRVGDITSINGQVGRGARGVIQEIENVGTIDFTIASPGRGYRFDQASQTAGDYSSTIQANVISDTGTGATLTVTSIVNTEDILVYTETIDGVANAPIGSTTFGNTSNAPGADPPSDTMAASDASTAMSSALKSATLSVGGIGAIRTDSGGVGYKTLPSITIIDPLISSVSIRDEDGNGFLGRNAVIAPSYRPGALKTLQIVNNGRDYVQGENLEITNTDRSSATDGTGVATVSGFTQDTGRYERSTGWPSARDKIHDGDYYQEFSYVIRAPLALKTYEHVIETLASPAISKMFSTIDHFNIFNVNDTSIRIQENKDSITSSIESKTNIATEDYKLLLSRSANTDETEFWNYVVAGKNIEESNLSNVLPLVQWTKDTVYNRFSGANDADPPSYIITSDNSVFKCLDNFNNQPSMYEPTRPESTRLWSPTVTQDGYVWKYMYRIDDDNEFKIANWIPVQTLERENESDQWLIQQNAVEGAITHVRVSATGTGYLTASGMVGDGATISQIPLDSTDIAPNNAYNGYTIFLTRGKGVNQKRVISSHTNGIINLTKDLNTAPDANSFYTIAPTLEITGDHIATANGRIVVEDTSIHRVIIDIGEEGEGYSHGDAAAAVASTPGYGQGATLSIDLPDEPHGTDAIQELGSHWIIISRDFNGTEEGNINTETSYATYALIANPEYKENVSTKENSYDLTTRLNIISETKMDGLWLEDHTINGSESNAQGIVVSFANTNYSHTSGILRVNTNDIFSIGDTITTNIGNVPATIKVVDESDLIKGSGEIVFIAPVERTERHPCQRDVFKTVIEF